MQAERLPRPCPVCGEIFEPRKTGGVWTKSCSRSCANELIARAMRNGGGSRASAARRLPERETLTCEVCGKEWTEAPSQVRNRRTCSIDCGAELRRQQGGEDRKGQANPNFKHGRKVGIRNRTGERAWYASMGKRCLNPGCSNKRGLILHHCVYRQALRRVGGDIWDTRNAMTLCAGCHMEHHQRSIPLPSSALPDSVFEFAAELLGAGEAFEYLRRRYSGRDVRLDALRELAS